MCSESRALGSGLRLEIFETSPSCGAQLGFAVDRLQHGFGLVVILPLSDPASGGAGCRSYLRSPLPLRVSTC